MTEEKYAIIYFPHEEQIVAAGRVVTLTEYVKATNHQPTPDWFLLYNSVTKKYEARQKKNFHIATGTKIEILKTLHELAQEENQKFAQRTLDALLK